MAAATERMVTAPRPLASASVTPADAISARLCSGDGPLAERSGLVQMLGPLAAAPRTGFIANTVLSKVACTQIANVDRSFSTAERYGWAMWLGDAAGRKGSGDDGGSRKQPVGRRVDADAFRQQRCGGDRVRHAGGAGRISG